MTGPQWESEAAEALADSGWRTAYANVTQNSDACLLDVQNLRTGECRRVEISAARFLTPHARQAELRRLLSN